ncbi:MAG: class I SAM-dependent methyltransferase [Phycisphaeraceae bacterium]|nr:class I SAM-dependent methyltransferase [Phycisphaeraceae bacterium]
MREARISNQLRRSARDRSVPDRRDQHLYADAALYDILHAPQTAQELNGVERFAASLLETPLPKQVWLEPACGSGRLIRLAAKRGRSAIGFDRDEGMIAYARARAERVGLPLRLFQADMTRFAQAVEPASVDVAFNIINTIRHIEHDDDMRAHLAEMARALRPGGVYIIGISLSAYGHEIPTEDVWIGRRGRCTVTQIVNFLPPVTPAERAARRERVLSHLIVERPRGVEHIDSTYTLRTYNRKQWLDLITSAGWAVLATADDQGNPHEPTEPGYAMWGISPKSSHG